MADTNNAAVADVLYEVVHDMVGPWVKAQLVTAAELAGAEVERLLELGAIRLVATLDDTSEG